MSASATRGNLAVLLVVLAVAGCVSGLDVRYPEAGANPALLASVPSRRVEMRPVTDRRVDAARIAIDREGKDVVTSRPVPDIVGEAIATELGKNGHAVGAPGDLVLATEIEDVWLDTVRGRGETQYVGKVVFTVTAVDGRTAQPLVARRYTGIKRHRVDKPSDDVAREVMNAALARSMHDLATDPALVAAFARATAAAAPAR